MERLITILQLSLKNLYEYYLYVNEHYFETMLLVQFMANKALMSKAFTLNTAISISDLTVYRPKSLGWLIIGQ